MLALLSLLLVAATVQAQGTTTPMKAAASARPAAVPFVHGEVRKVDPDKGLDRAAPRRHPQPRDAGNDHGI